MKEYKFDPVRATEECVEWIKNWFENASVEPKIMLQTEQLSTAQNMIENNF